MGVRVTALRETVAMWIYHGTPRNKPWALLSDRQRKDWMLRADAALTALDAAGYAVVPREPCEAMRKAGTAALAEDEPRKWKAGDVWAAMVEAGEKQRP